MLVDSHCHLDFPDFSDDLDGIVSRAAASGVGRMVTISTRVRRLNELIAIAERYDNVYCSVGTHPHHADEEDGISADELVALTDHPKVVALGEAGLDYFYDNGSPEAQARGFRAHIAAARATGLPLVVHTREADEDCGRILEEEAARGSFAAVLHCYTGGRELAMKAISLGLFMTLTLTILGCGSSAGVPRPALGWGACDPNNPKNRRRRCSLMVEQTAEHGTTRIVIDTAPDLREQLIDANVDHIDAVFLTHEHADQTHGMDDLRSVVLHMRRRIPTYFNQSTAKDIMARFSYCFISPEGSDYPPILTRHSIEAGESQTILGRGGAVTLTAFLVHRQRRLHA